MYSSKDILLEGLAGPEGVTWSVHHPTTIFGFSPRSARNVVASLCVYAAICRKEGVMLRWPGSRVAWEGFNDASNAELVAGQALWAALEPMGKNEPFNCSNGDIYKWQQLWPMRADHFGVEWAGYLGEDQRFKLEEAMAGREGGGVGGDRQRERARGDRARRDHQLVVRRRRVRRGEGATGHHEQELGVRILRIPEHGEVLQCLDQKMKVDKIVP